MKILWCWRCKMEVPMLDETEFGKVHAVQTAAVRSIRDFRKTHILPLDGVDVAYFMAPVCAAYTKITGFPETNANAVHHHRLSLYGPPCPECGKPFRTPQAGFCAECGYRP